MGRLGHRVRPTASTPVTRGLHIGFRAPSRAAVDAFWQAGIDAGYRDDGAPGPRTVYGPDYYGGFLLDPGRQQRGGGAHRSRRPRARRLASTTSGSACATSPRPSASTRRSPRTPGCGSAPTSRTRVQIDRRGLQLLADRRRAAARPSTSTSRSRTQDERDRPGVPRRRARRGLRGPRRARRARRLPPGLLRRVRPRPRRTQRRGRQPQRVSRAPAPGSRPGRSPARRS